MFAIKYLKPISKYLLGFLVLLILVGGIFIYLQNRAIEVNFDENGAPIMPEKGWYESRVGYMKRVVRWQEELKRMQAQDDFGGATPQETFDAFVQALKEGDTEKASRYFVFNKQEQMAKELAVGKERGNLDLLIGDLEKEKVGGEIIGGYRFTTIGDDGSAEFSFDLEFNEDTGVWKMESL